MNDIKKYNVVFILFGILLIFSIVAAANIFPSASIDGNTMVFVKATDNSIWYRTSNGIAWDDWNSLGGIVTSDPEATVSTAPFGYGNPVNINVFARDADDSLWYRTWDGTAWSDWNSLGGKITSDPKAVSIDDTIYVFARGIDNALWYRTWDGTAWSDWNSLGGIVTSKSGVSADGDQLSVFVRGVGNDLWQRKFDGTTWADWQNLGGIIKPDPDATSDTVFARGDDNALWYRTWDGGSWQSLNGILTSGPVAVSDSGTTDVFALGADSDVWQRRYGGTWNSWNNLGGILASNPDSTSLGPDSVIVFGRGTDDNLWYKNWDGTSWSNWDNLGGILRSRPEAVSWS